MVTLSTEASLCGPSKLGNEKEKRREEMQSGTYYLKGHQQEQHTTSADPVDVGIFRHLGKTVTLNRISARYISANFHFIGEKNFKQNR